MRHLQSEHPDELLVGPDTGDDAAVWQIDAEQAIVSTADFITPVIDDARTWGRVAAANSVSDIYAMGGRPLFALNLVGWNADELSTDLLSELLAGGQDIASAAGFAIVGGHTIDDPEPKYGMSITGMVHPDHILRNSGLRAGDDLILTKPLGVGVLTTAIKFGAANDDETAAAIASMIRLNDIGATLAIEAGATGATDVTGFGLLGHLGRMALESQVSATIEFDALPFLPGAVEHASGGIMPGGSRRNLEWALDFVDVGNHPELHQLLAADAQTSGGLVFGVDPSETSGILTELAATGHTAARIGTATATEDTPGIVLR